MFEQVIGAGKEPTVKQKRADLAFFLSYLVVALIFVGSAFWIETRPVHQAVQAMYRNHDPVGWTFAITFWIVLLAALFAFLPAVRDAWDGRLPSPMLGVIITFTFAATAIAVATHLPSVLIVIGVVELFAVGSVSWLRVLQAAHRNE